MLQNWKEGRPCSAQSQPFSEGKLRPGLGKGHVQLVAGQAQDPPRVEVIEPDLPTSNPL